MSDELAPFESAARIYCESMGYDPDEQRQIPHPTLKNVTTPVFRWQAAAEELIDFSKKLTALKQAAQLPKEPFVPFANRKN